MLTAKANKRLSLVGPGTPMGGLLRRYWHPVATTTDLARESRAARAPARRGPRALSDRAGEARTRGAALSPPRLLAGLRHPRGRRPALRLSRLEVRPERRLPGAAGRAAREHLPPARLHPRLSGPGAGRPRLGLPGPGAGAAAAALRPAGLGRPGARDRLDGAALQLAPDHGELHGPGPPGVPAHRVLQLPAPAAGQEAGDAGPPPREDRLRRVRVRHHEAPPAGRRDRGRRGLAGGPPDPLAEHPGARRGEWPRFQIRVPTRRHAHAGLPSTSRGRSPRGTPPQDEVPVFELPLQARQTAASCWIPSSART